ncbi:MAG: DNA-3-methyladenine glycosylase 2 family protein [Tepidisphaeraceae bacterium]|jgi:DNA-3-methyladenine glycosylase II
MKSPDWSAARRHLERDPVLRDIITAMGPCTLGPQRDHFLLLCRAIFSQQISSAVAAVLFGRFREQFPRKRPTPAGVLNFLTRGNEAALKICGLSRQKRNYLIDLSRHFLAGKIPSRMSEMSDEQVIEALTAVQGIGPWTAEMFLMFVLNRPDVLPADDLGLQSAVKSAYRLPHRPKRAELLQMAEPWRPYRTIASWYLWRAADAADGGWD